MTIKDDPRYFLIIKGKHGTSRCWINHHEKYIRIRTPGLWLVEALKASPLINEVSIIHERTEMVTKREKLAEWPKNIS
jgi:hypothetical protein